VRPESVREADEFRLVDRLQQPPHRLLDDLVLQRRDTDRPRRAVPFRDLDAAYRLRVVASTVNAAYQVAQALVETLAVRFPRDPVHPCRRLPSKALVCLSSNGA